MLHSFKPLKINIKKVLKYLLHTIQGSFKNTKDLKKRKKKQNQREIKTW